MQHLPPNGWDPNHPCMPIIKSRTTLPALPFCNFLLWVLLGVLTFPCCVHCLIFKVGVLGPWNCDPVYYRALPTVAAKLAVSRINGDPSLNLGLTMDFIVLQEPCETSKALTAYIYYDKSADAFVGPTNPGYCIAASLLAKNWDKALFSFSCVTFELERMLGYPTFSLTVPFPVDVLFTVFKHFRWASSVVVSSNEDIWIDTAGRVAAALRRRGLPVGLVTAMGLNDTEVESTLRKIQNAVIIMCMHSLLVGGEYQVTFLTKAHKMGMTAGKYVFVPYDTLHYSVPYSNVSHLPLQNSSLLREAYDAVLTITVASELLSFNEAFTAAKRSQEVTLPVQAEQVGECLNVPSVDGFNLLCFFFLRSTNDLNQEVHAGNPSDVSESKECFPLFICCSRALCRWGCRADHASVLPFWRHRQHCLSYGIHWAASVSLKRLLHIPLLFVIFFPPHCFKCPPPLSAYRIHVNCSTVKILRSLNDGYKIDVRGKTELKVTHLEDDDEGLVPRVLRRIQIGVTVCSLLSVFFMTSTNNCEMTQVLLCLSFSLSELFWTAPEFLRDHANFRKGTYKGDVYSFSIILQEVVVRGPPYCMLDLSPEEILRKVKKPPPMCRPTVAPDQAPLECIQLMKQCWSEQPDRRPNFDEIFDRFKIINKGKKTNIIDSMLRMLEQYSSNLEDLIRERTEELEVEKQRTEKLLSEMLPPSVAEALKTGATVQPEYFDQVTIYFSDIVGFTTISSLSDPIEVVDLLNDLYTLFDAVLSNHDVYKVETIGDAYMVASGLPKRNGNKHAAEIANMSLNILSSVGSFHMRHMPDVPVRIRIGIHSGPCVAGVVGLTMPRYCLFGDTVNTASRMESTGLPYRIHVNCSTVKILRSLNDGYKIDVRGKTELKGKGIEETYWLVGKSNFSKPLPKPPEIKPG
uniref:guanylate cyclase n=1 Tax=Fundulus heteroclitus TaxID=8078 RepID=A0A3Q2Q4T9_FUNHE